MFLENNEETRDFVTVYEKEYTFKRLKKCYRTEPFFAEYIMSNIITDPSKHLLNLEKENKRLPFHMRTESLTDYLIKVRNERPHLKKFLRDPPDEVIVEREGEKLFKSNYQLEFTKDLDRNKLIEDKKIIHFAVKENHLIAETTQKKSFRNPQHLNNMNLLGTRKMQRPPDNLNVNQKEREIFKMRVEESEYQVKINKVGNRIMSEQFHGPPIAFMTTVNRRKRPNFEKSICSQISMNVSGRYVLSQIF